jgi:hypothetical protein
MEIVDLQKGHEPVSMRGIGAMYAIAGTCDGDERDAKTAGGAQDAAHIVRMLWVV